MQVLLRIANGKSNVRKVRIQSDTVIGRSPECQLKVASNQISRRHCQIVIRDTIVAIKDLGSANGTFVNGRQVPPEVEIPLTPGTRVMLGPLQFTVEYDLPGMSAVAVAVPAASVESARATQPQAQVETRQVVPPNDNTPFPPYVVVPPKDSAPQPGTTPAATAVSAPVPISTGPPPTDIAIPAMMAAVMPPAAAAVAVATPVAVAPPPVEVPVPVAPTEEVPSPAAPPFFVPGGEAAAEAENEGGEFNFGIFAASGSDVIVESAPEIPMVSEPEEPVASKPETAKPAKKGLLQMFGWGKKKASAPEPEPAAEATPEPQAPENDEEIAVEQPVAAEGLSFEFPAAEDEAAADDDSSDESLQNFFNNFK